MDVWMDVWMDLLFTSLGSAQFGAEETGQSCQ